jgi:PAS domain S-box-containing protein
MNPQPTMRTARKRVPCGEVMTAAKSNHETESTLQAKSNDVPELVVVTSGDAENEDVPERYQTREDLEKALNEAKKSEAHLRKIIDTIPTFAWCGLPDGSKEFFNQRWHDYTGLSLEEAHGWGWKVTIHPDDLELLLDKWFKIIASGEPGEIEARVRRFDGEYRWFLFRTVPVRDDQGKIVRWHGTNTDIEDRKRAEAALHWSETLLAGQKRVVEMIAKGDALPRILDALCRAVEEQSSDVLSSFLLLDANGTHLRHGAAPRLPQSYIEAIDGVAIAPTGGSCITAAYRAAPVVVSDIAVDPLWADYRELPLRTACEPAGPHRSFPLKPRCWVPSRCTIASLVVRVHKTCLSLNRSLLWRRFPSSIRGLKKSSGKTKGSFDRSPMPSRRPSWSWDRMGLLSTPRRWAGWARRTRWRTPSCFSHPTTRATSRERNCSWMAASHNCRALISVGAGAVLRITSECILHQQSQTRPTAWRALTTVQQTSKFRQPSSSQAQRFGRVTRGLLIAVVQT